MHIRSVAFKKWFCSALVVFSILAVVSPLHYLNASTPAEDKELADFARSFLGFNNSMVELAKQYFPALPNGQVLAANTGGDYLPVAGADLPLPPAECSGDPALPSTPACAAFEQQVVNNSNALVQQAAQAATNQPMPKVDAAKVQVVSDCFANYFSQFLTNFSTTVDYSRINDCMAGAGNGAQVLGATTAPINYEIPNFFLLRPEGDPTVYFVNDFGLKLPMFTDKVFYSYGNKMEDVKTVSQAEIDVYPTAQYISIGENETVYKVDLSSGTKQRLSPQVVFRLGVKIYNIMRVNKTELDSYKNGADIL